MRYDHLSLTNHAVLASPERVLKGNDVVDTHVASAVNGTNQHLDHQKAVNPQLL